jgi:hypothetical protein
MRAAASDSDTAAASTVSRRSSSASASARWTPDLTRSGRYAVYAWTPGHAPVVAPADPPELEVLDAP